MSSGAGGKIDQRYGCTMICQNSRQFRAALIDVRAPKAVRIKADPYEPVLPIDRLQVIDKTTFSVVGFTSLPSPNTA